MTDPEFKKWKVEHGTLFRFADEDLRMIDLWRSSFESRDFSGAELSAASRILAEGKQAKLWRAEHLDFLLSQVSAIRLGDQRRRQEMEDAAHEEDRCKLCNGAGLIIVPHPFSLKEDGWHWPYYESSIACDCYKGIRLFNRQAERAQEFRDDRKQKGIQPAALWSIQQYEVRFPHWREAMQEREISRRAVKQARQQSSYEDRRRGPLSQALATVAGRQPS